MGRPRHSYKHTLATSAKTGPPGPIYRQSFRRKVGSNAAEKTRTNEPLPDMLRLTLYVWMLHFAIFRTSQQVHGHSCLHMFMCLFGVVQLNGQLLPIQLDAHLFLISVLWGELQKER